VFNGGLFDCYSVVYKRDFYISGNGLAEYLATM
jgi:hypothetical protein